MAETEKEKAERERASWQYRAIRATQGSKSKIGAVLLAVLGKQRMTRPQFGNSANINADGFVLTNMFCKDGTIKLNTAIGKADQMVDGFRTLADVAGLNDVERVEMFQKLQAWIFRDDRVVRDWSPRAGRVQ